MTDAELVALWVDAGGELDKAALAVAIAMAESGGCQYALAGPVDDRPVKLCTYRPTVKENSYGLWQINRDAHPGYTAAELYTPAGNAKAAVAISLRGANFGAWTTYTQAKYAPYLPAAQTAAAAVLASLAVPPGPTGTAPGAAPAGLAGPVGTVNVNQSWNSLTHALSHHMPMRMGQVTEAARRIRRVGR